MTPDRIAAILLGSAETTFVASALLLGQYALGWVFVRLPGLRTPNTIAFNIAAGLAVTTGICWYVYAALGALQGALPAIATCSFVALAFVPILEVRSVSDGDGGRLFDSPLTGGIVTLVCILFAVSIFYHAISPTGETAAVVLGNNDTYAWALAADRIRSVVSDIHGATPFWQRVLPDAAGTQQILALLARIRGTTAFEALPYFHITVTSLICLATYELCRAIGRLKPVLAFLVALGTSTSTFYFYIYLNGFFGQLVGTFAALAGIGTALWGGLELVGSRSRRLVTRVFAISFPTAVIFTSYQSGFLPFAVLILCTSGAIVFAVNRPRGFRAALRPVLETIAAPTLLAVAAIAILFPEIADHVVSRTWSVAAAGAGWPIPIIDPRHFVGLSWFGRFGEGRGTLPYYLIFWVDAGLLAFALRRGQQTEQTRANAGALAAFLGFVFLYLLAYALKGPIYQVWKLAAYTVLPLGFVPLGALLALPAAWPARKLAGGWRIILPTAAAVIVILSLTTWVLDGRPASLASLTANLRALSAAADQSEGVVLDMPPYRDTMVAMNLLHPHGPIVPLQISYLPATAPGDPVLSQPGFTVIHSAACAEQRVALAGDLPPAPAGSDRYMAEPWAATGGGAYYAFGTSTCIGGTSFAILDTGLSGAEPWGRWSSAPEAALKLSGFSGQPLIVKIRMQPFAVGGHAKRLGVAVNGRSYGMIITARPGILMLPVPAWLNDKPEITLAFSFPDHIKLTELDPNSSDTRDIAFGFVDLLITTTVDEAPTNPGVLQATFREFPG